MQLPVDSISKVVKTTLEKLDVESSNETIVTNMFQTTSNLLKYMKEGSKTYNNTGSS